MGRQGSSDKLSGRLSGLDPLTLYNAVYIDKYEPLHHASLRSSISGSVVWRRVRSIAGAS